MSDVEYRFAQVKDASWNSYHRQLERFLTIEHLIDDESVGAEIGVYKGGFGEFLRTKAKTLYLVDPWHLLKPYWGPEKTADMSAVGALIEILEVYRTEIDEGRVLVVPDFGARFLTDQPDDAFDWIYLDASHLYEQTLEEIEIAALKVKPGGVLIGDDYDADPSSNQYGVYRAVNEFLARSNTWKLILNDKRQWAARRLQ